LTLLKGSRPPQPHYTLTTSISDYGLGAASQGRRRQSSSSISCGPAPQVPSISEGWIGEIDVVHRGKPTRPRPFVPRLAFHFRDELGGKPRQNLEARVVYLRHQAAPVLCCPL
jgi:hypothetical protein